MDPQTQLSLFGAWRHPAMGGIQGIQGMGMDLTQAAYRYNQNMMEYYTCKSKSLGWQWQAMIHNRFTFETSK